MSIKIMNLTFMSKSIEREVAVQSTSKKPLNLNSYSVSDAEAPGGFEQESFEVEGQVKSTNHGKKRKQRISK